MDTVDELRNSNRQSVVRYLSKCMLDHAKRLVAEKKITLQPNSTVEALCENRALQIEHHLYLNHFAGGQIVSEYQKKSRSISANLKSNSSLSDEILGGRLSCERLSHMTTEEMASEELKELTQQVRLESEKHNTLINETGPRIRRTHKGEELVNEEITGQSGQDTLLESGTLIRRPTEPLDEPLTHDDSAQPDSPAQPNDISMSPPTLETPRSPQSNEASAPPPDKKNRSFSIENVWSHVESPDTERRPSRAMPTRPPPAPKPVDSKIDKDIDMLLKDEDQDVGTPPYSPAAFDDHYSPKPDPDHDSSWHGRVEMNQLASIDATASLLGGPENIGEKKWFELIDSVLNIDGRIKHERATEYLCGQKFSKSSSMVLASLKPQHSSNQAQFDRLFDYFKSKERYAVVGKHDLPCIKDLYIVPIDANETLPDWFNVVDPPSKVPEKSRNTKMLVLIFVVIRSLVPGNIENGIGGSTRKFSASLQQVPGFGTPQQPLASPYAPHIPQQQQYQNAPLSHQRQHQFSPSPAPYANHSPGQYGYANHQPQQQPLPPIQNPQYPQGSQQQQQQHPQPLPPLQHPMEYAPRTDWVPAHAMTRELMTMIPNLGETQARAIDKILQENPELESNPDLLAKEVEKVLGSGA